MRVMQGVVLCVGMVGLAALAAEPNSRRVQSVPIEYVSPGATGSVSVSSSSQSSDVYGGSGVPSEYGSTQSHAYGSFSGQQGGGIRQSVKYPGGLDVQRYPGQTQY